MDCAILKNTDIMVGADIHAASPSVVVPPGAEKTLPPSPHAVFAPLMVGPWGAMTGSGDVRVRNLGQTTMVVGTDIGMFIPHIPSGIPIPNARAFLLPLGSSSTSNFGASSVLTSKGPVAIAVMQVVGVNSNCADMPFAGQGFVPAFTTNLAGVYMGDLVAGAMRMVYGEVVGAMLGKVSDFVMGKVLPGFINATLGKLVASNLPLAVAVGTVSTAMKGKATTEFAKKALNTAVSKGVNKAYSAATKVAYSVSTREDFDKSKDINEVADQFANQVAQYLNTNRWPEYPATPPPGPAAQDEPTP